MVENREYITHNEELGCIHISEDVLAAVSAGAAAEVDGICGMMNLAAKKTGAKGVRVTVEDNAAVIDLYVMMRYGYAIPDVAEKVQNAVSAAVEAMTGFSVKAINVHVGGVSFQ